MIEVRAVGASRVDVRHPKRSAALRIEIGIKHTGAAAELELEAASFADLERRFPEMAHQFVGRETVELAPDLGRGRWRRCGLRDLRRAHARCKQNGGSKGE